MDYIKANWKALLSTSIGTLLLALNLGLLNMGPADFNLNPKSDTTNTTLIIDTPGDYLQPNSQAWGVVGQVIVYGEYKTLIMNWGGVGGLILYSTGTATEIAYAQAHGKKVVINLTDNAYSASAIVPCYADKVIYNGHFLMFHEVEIDGKVATRPEDQYNHSDFDVCVAKGILTKEQVKEMDAGNEIYIYSDHSEIKPDNRPR